VPGATVRISPQPAGRPVSAGGEIGSANMQTSERGGSSIGLPTSMSGPVPSGRMSSGGRFPVSTKTRHGNAAIDAAFARLLDQTAGKIFYCADDPGAVRVCAKRPNAVSSLRESPADRCCG
jgi:hypothetical protein